MISYYELLGMIKEGNIPNKIKVHITSYTTKVYVRQNDLDLSFSHYRLDCLDDNKETVDDNYHYYLAEDFLESTMFYETIEILEDEKNIEKIHWKPKESLEGEFNSKEKQDILARRTERLKKSINEIIDLLNKGE